jgi:hypothetical protein
MHDTRDYAIGDLAELSSALRPTVYRILRRRPAATSPGKSALGSRANVMGRFKLPLSGRFSGSCARYQQEQHRTADKFLRDRNCS